MYANTHKKNTRIVFKMIFCYNQIGDNMDCIFCKIINKDINSKIVYEDGEIISIMDINPHAMGHVLILPKEHYEDYKVTPKEIIAHMYDVANKIGDNIMNKLYQNGYSLVINYGDAQEVKHLHMHLIPSNHEKDYDLEEVYKKIAM